MSFAEIVDMLDDAGEPIVLEPHKLESRDWYELDDLPENLFGCVSAYVESYKTVKNTSHSPVDQIEINRLKD